MTRERWWLAEEARGLVGPDGLPLRAWLAAGQATVVKDAPHRTVYRVVVAGLDVHVKLYRADRRERWRLLFRPAKARAEGAIGREVARRGVPTPEVLGHGERGGESYLVTRTLPDAVSLLDYLEQTLPALPPCEGARTRQALARVLGAFLAGAHRAGVCHHDLHPGNLLLRFTPDGPALYVIDLHAVRLSRPLGWRASRDNLVLLDHWAALRYGQADRRRAWRAYHAGRADLRLNERLAAAEMQASSERSLIAFARQLDRRCHGGNRHFRAFAGDGVVGYAVADLAPEETRRLIAGLAGDLPPAARVLKHSATSTVAAIDLSPGDDPRPALYKRLPAGWRDALASLFRAPPALRSYRLGHALRLRGVPTPRPLAVWHCGTWGLCRDGHLLTDLLPEAVDLLAFARGVADGDRRRAVIEDAADALRHLHQRGASHRDLKAANLLVSRRGWVMGQRGVQELAGTGRERVWLIDLVGARILDRITRWRRVRDLGRLYVSFRAEPSVSRADRLRFLMRYLGRAGAKGESWKAWWREIECAGRAKIERNRRRGRVVG